MKNCPRGPEREDGLFQSFLICLHYIAHVTAFCLIQRLVRVCQHTHIYNPNHKNQMPDPDLNPNLALIPKTESNTDIVGQCVSITFNIQHPLGMSVCLLVEENSQ